MHGRRVFQTFFVALLVAYCTLLLYQSFLRGGFNEQAILNGKGGKDYRFEFNYISEDRDEMVAAKKVMSEIPPVTTTTLRPQTTTLDDLFISVKTTKRYHKSRLYVILKTWFQLAKEQTWFFTDSDDKELQNKTYGHVINTKCPASHHRKALCCKMSVEFDAFMDTDKKWFCHFDDDNYVNVPRLVEFLKDYNPKEDWYLGKPSIQRAFEISSKNKTLPKIKFWFGTGGAGVCISRALALKMMPAAGGGQFMRTGEKIRLPDDVTMGYIIEHLLKKPLTVVNQFHSHLEPMKFIRRELLKDQISFSYSSNNIIKIDGFDILRDPTRFLSLHCLLFPYFKFCPR